MQYLNMTERNKTVQRIMLVDRRCDTPSSGGNSSLFWEQRLSKLSFHLFLNYPVFELRHNALSKNHIQVQAPSFQGTTVLYPELFQQISAKKYNHQTFTLPLSKR